MNNKLILLRKDQMRSWGKPEILPPGAYDYILHGNPSSPELYTFRFQLPAHYEIRPFSLTALCCMTVLSGQLYIGQGNKFNKTDYQLMPTESFVVIPSNSSLYFWTDEQATLQFHGIGPINFIYNT